MRNVFVFSDFHWLFSLQSPSIPFYPFLHPVIQSSSHFTLSLIHPFLSLFHSVIKLSKCFTPSVIHPVLSLPHSVIQSSDHFPLSIIHSTLFLPSVNNHPAICLLSDPSSNVSHFLSFSFHVCPAPCPSLAASPALPLCSPRYLPALLI